MASERARHLDLNAEDLKGLIDTVVTGYKDKSSTGENLRRMEALQGYVEAVVAISGETITDKQKTDLVLQAIAETMPHLRATSVFGGADVDVTTGGVSKSSKAIMAEFVGHFGVSIKVDERDWASSDGGYTTRDKNQVEKKDFRQVAANIGKIEVEIPRALQGAHETFIASISKRAMKERVSDARRAAARGLVSGNAALQEEGFSGIARSAAGAMQKKGASLMARAKAKYGRSGAAPADSREAMQARIETSDGSRLTGGSGGGGGGGPSLGGRDGDS